MCGHTLLQYQCYDQNLHNFVGTFGASFYSLKFCYPFWVQSSIFFGLLRGRGSQRLTTGIHAASELASIRMNSHNKAEKIDHPFKAAGLAAGSVSITIESMALLAKFEVKGIEVTSKL